MAFIKFYEMFLNRNFLFIITLERGSFLSTQLAVQAAVKTVLEYKHEASSLNPTFSLQS